MARLVPTPADAAPGFTTRSGVGAEWSGGARPFPSAVQVARHVLSEVAEGVVQIGFLRPGLDDATVCPADPVHHHAMRLNAPSALVADARSVR